MYSICYPVTRRDEMQNRCSLLKMRCRNAAQDEMLSLEEMLQRMTLIIIKLKYSKHEKYIKWPSSHAFFILPHTTLLWTM